LALKKATITLSGFEECTHYISGKTFIYYDPPYRPLTNTAQFTSYSKDGFNDDSQIRLAELFRKLDKKGTFQLLSNSDPTNSGKFDPFFDNLYRDFHIQRVEAKRMINSNARKRHVLREILIKNYQ
jgi:DNA adenine methylase